MGPATTRDFRRAAERVIGRDLGWFFDQWIRQGGIPEITVEPRLEQSPEGGWVLAGQAIQDPGPEFKKIHIPLFLDFGKGPPEVRLVFQEQPTTEFRFELESKPRKVQVDPADNNLAIYHR
jgi:aminopeptidase N